jgi:hypothetical protein
VRRQSSHALFERLIIAPTSFGFPTPDRRIVVLIDRLDEATRDGNNDLAEFLSEHAEVMHPLQALDPTVIDASSNENEQDVIE